VGGGGVLPTKMHKEEMIFYGHEQIECVVEVEKWIVFDLLKNKDETSQSFNADLLV